MMWYESINQYCTYRKVRKGLSFELVPDKWYKQKVMRKDNEDGSFELCSVAWHTKHWNGEKHVLNK